MSKSAMERLLSVEIDALYQDAFVTACYLDKTCPFLHVSLMNVAENQVPKLSKH